MFFRATLFTTYYQMTTLFAGDERRGKRLTHAEYFLSGMATGLTVAFVEGPIDMFKSKMQVQIIQAKQGHPPIYRNVFHCAYIIWKGYGLRGVYQGLSGTLLRNIPANSIFFGFYEVSRDLLTPKGGSVSDLSPGAVMFAGGVGGFFYWILTYPTDVIKSALQADDVIKSKRKYKGLVDCVQKMYKEDGWRRFFRGLTPCLMRSLPANATMFVVVERARLFLDRHLYF